MDLLKTKELLAPEDVSCTLNINPIKEMILSWKSFEKKIKVPKIIIQGNIPIGNIAAVIIWKDIKTKHVNF